jgi:hypothetical protein
MALASWLPVRPGLTPHGLHHGHQTWLDDFGIRCVLQYERIGHEVPGMRGVCSHITLGMRAAVKTGLQELWEESLRQRAQMAPTSALAVLDRQLAPQREPIREADTAKIGSQTAPKIGQQRREPMLFDREQAADLRFIWGERWDSNPRHPGPQPGALTN